jgi:hypothetical protein
MIRSIGEWILNESERADWKTVEEAERAADEFIEARACILFPGKSEDYSSVTRGDMYYADSEQEGSEFLDSHPGWSMAIPADGVLHPVQRLSDMPPEEGIELLQSILNEPERWGTLEKDGSVTPLKKTGAGKGERIKLSIERRDTGIRYKKMVKGKVFKSPMFREDTPENQQIAWRKFLGWRKEKVQDEVR